MSLFRNATFVLSAHELRDLPAPAAPEIAFAGRSNAGKSSAINALVHHARLAFVSKTPGRTQLINYFRLRGGAFLVDLPGYGYARVPRPSRDHWEGLLSGYLQSRSSLFGLVLIMDIRHPLTPLDETMLAWFRPTGKPVHVLLTKADKLPRAAAETALRRVRGRLAELAPNFTVQLFSALKRTGIDVAEQVLGGWLGVEQATQPPPHKTSPSKANKARDRNKKAPAQAQRGSGSKQNSPEPKGKARGRTP
jgi:GTP-binding protein